MEQRNSLNPYLPSEDQTPDFKRYLSLFLSNWYWFAASLFFTLTIVYGINRYSEEVFTSSSTLLIKDEQYGGGMSDMENIIPGGDIFKSKQNLKNEIGILKSFSLNNRVMNELKEFHIVYIAVGRRKIVEKKLYKTSPFIVIPDTAENQPTLYRVNIEILNEKQYNLNIDGDYPLNKTMNFGDRFNEKGFDFVVKWRSPGKTIIDPDASRRYYFYFESPERLANYYRNRLNIKPIQEEASLVILTISGSVPDQETEYLNKLMELYIGQGLELKNQTADSTIKFIDRQLNSISESLKAAEAKLENFRLENRFLNLTSEGSLIQNRIEQYQNEQGILEFQLSYYKYLLGYLDSQNESGAIVSPSLIGITDQTLFSLVSDLAKYQMLKKDMDFNLKSNVEAIRLCEEKIVASKLTLRDNVVNSISNLNRTQEENKKKIDSVEVEFLKLPGTERDLINIQREFDLNNTVYTYLLNKRAEAGIAKASTVSVNRIIDRAGSYNRSLVSPNPKKNYAIALILGLFFPMVLILLIDYLNNKVIDKKDIERITEVPVIGYIGHNDSKNEVPIKNKPGSTLAESFRSIRTALKFFIREDEHAVIAITSTISSEGKTFIAINLATIIAMLDKKVLLVGLDLRKPRIHKVLEIGNENGMSTYLSSNTDFNDIIFKTDIKNLYYVPSGPVPPNPSELIESIKMREFIIKVRKEFDYVIIDTPPIAIVTDALLVTKLVDVNLVVVRQRFTSRNTLNLIQDLYKDKKLINPGIILNDISLTGYYGYGLRYGYSLGYGYSYGFNYYGKYGYKYYGKGAHGYYTEE